MPDDIRHELWLIYSQLKDAESDEERRLDLLERSREQLGEVINKLHREFQPDLSAMMAAAGARGGAVKTEAKAASSRANGAKGGRPPSTYFCRDCAPLSDDPDNQRLIDCSDSPYAKKKTCSECSGPAYYRLE